MGTKGVLPLVLFPVVRKSKGAWIAGLVGLLWIVAFHVLPHLDATSTPLLVIGQAPPFLLVVPPALAALAMLVLGRGFRNRGVVLSSVAIALGAATLGHPVPRPPSSPDDRKEDEVRVMTFNVHYRSRKMPDMLREIEAKMVDVVLLQENVREPDSPMNQIRKVRPDWHYQAAGDVAIASRWPIRNVRTVKQRSSPGRVAMLADIEAPKPFQAAVIHWSVPQYKRGPQKIWRGSRAQGNDYEDTMKLLWPAIVEAKPLVLGGDFNAQPHHPGLGKINGLMTNCFLSAGSGYGWTFPASRPLVQIDHLLVAGGIQPVRAWVGSNLGSDHRPVFADVRLP